MTSETTSIEVFCGEPQAYRRSTNDILLGQWQRAVTELPLGVGSEPIRVDIAERSTLVDLAAMTLRNPASGTTLWTITKPAEIGKLGTGENTERFGSLDTAKFCRFASAAGPVRLILPSFDADLDEPLALEIWLRVHADVASLLPLLKQQDGSRELNALKSEYAEAIAERNALQATTRKLQGELYISKVDARRETDKLTGEITFLRERLANSFAALNEALDNQNKASVSFAEEIAELRRKLAEAERSALRAQELEQTLTTMTNSRSWKLTAPLRKILGHG